MNNGNETLKIPGLSGVTGGADPYLANLLNSTNTMFANMSQGFELQGVLFQIKPFTDYNILLKGFVDDIRSGGDLLPEEAEESYVRALIGKLKGAARDST